MMAETGPEQNGLAEGRVVRVIGPVVDVEFPPAELPEIHTALTVDLTLEDETTTITCEVAQHIGDSTIRAPLGLKRTAGACRRFCAAPAMPFSWAVTTRSGRRPASSTGRAAPTTSGGPGIG